MTDDGASVTAFTAPRPITWPFALTVVAGSFVVAAAVRALIIVVASAQAPHDESPLQTILVGAALALVIGYMLAVIGVGVSTRNRRRGGTFTVIFAAVLLAAHLFTGFTHGMAILRLPHYVASTDYSPLVLAPLLFTVPSAFLKVIRWRVMVLVTAIGLVVASVLGAITG